MSNETNTPKVREKKTNKTVKKETTRNRNTTAKKKTTTKDVKTTSAKAVREPKVKQIKETPKVVEAVNKKKIDTKVEENKKNKVLIKILDIVLWIVLIVWMLIVVIDYVKVINQKDPIFCLKEEEIKYEDGTVNSCTGPGYKVYVYNRESYQAIEFGPIWAKVRNDDSRK